MAAEESEKIKTLKIALDELRRVHDHVSNSYDQLRTKALAMIASEVAIGAFLFSTPITLSTLSSQIFFAAGFLGLLGAFTLLIRSVSSGDWFVPGDMDEIEQIDNGTDNRYDTLEKFLFFLRKDYLEGTRECIGVVNRRAKWVNWGLYLLLASVIILIALKYGGSGSGKT